MLDIHPDHDIIGSGSTTCYPNLFILNCGNLTGISDGKWEFLSNHLAAVLILILILTSHREFGIVLTRITNTYH